MNKALVISILAVMLLAVPFAAAKGKFHGWKDAIDFLDEKLDALIADHDEDVATLQAQIDALTARVVALETPPSDGGPGAGDGSTPTPPDLPPDGGDTGESPGSPDAPPIEP